MIVTILPLFLKSILALVLVLLLAWVCCFILKKIRPPSPATKNLIHILDSYGLEANRKILLFSSPFGQGVILLSPRGEQIQLFQNTLKEDRCTP